MRSDVSVFTRQLYCQEMVKNLQFCQQNRGLEVYAYVIMSSHLHLIVRRQQQNGLLSELLRDFNRAGVPECDSKKVIETNS